MILAFRKDPAASGCGLCDIDAFFRIGKKLEVQVRNYTYLFGLFSLCYDLPIFRHVIN